MNTLETSPVQHGRGGNDYGGQRKPRGGCAAIHLRPAEAFDEGRLYDWRNRPEIVALGSTHRSVSLEQHRSWFADSLTGISRSIYIIEADGQSVGQIRFDWHEAKQAEVSIYLLSEFIGRGLGLAALREGCRLALASGRANRIVARIRRENGRSHSVFVKTGFVESPDEAPVAGHDTLVLFALISSVPHNRLTFGREEELAVQRVVRSGVWAAGAELAELERRLALAAGVAHAVGVGSGVAALRLSLLALGVGPGDSVAVPAYSCVALPNAVLACGARPVAVDVLADTWTISAEAVAAVLTEGTCLKAAIAVHTFGCLAPVQAIEALGVPVVEDCSHAFGTPPFGALGRVAMLSLYATKLLGAGEGGMVLTNDVRLATAVRAARDYTDQAPSARRLNDKMTDLEAALGLCQLERLPGMLARRRELAGAYEKALAVPMTAHGGSVPADSPGRVWYRYAVAVDEADELVAALGYQGVTAVRPVENWGGAAPDATPVAHRAYRRLVSLPLYPTLTEGEQAFVCTAALNALAKPCCA